jgi:hypothetical protein
MAVCNAFIRWAGRRAAAPLSGMRLEERFSSNQGLELFLPWTKIKLMGPG